MGIAYQLTFFLALTLLAIVITIFVFAVSLLGRAVEVSSKEQEESERKHKDATEREIAGIKKQISDLAKKKHINQELRELGARLKQLRKRDKKSEKELNRIRSMPELLRVKGGVVHPGVSLGIALVLTGLAWYLSTTIETFAIPIPLIIWILSVVAIVYSSVRIYRSLKVVESVAITSEEAALRRTIQAFKIAQKEIEEERKPELALSFEGEQPPLHVEAGAQLAIKFELNLIRGDLARKPIVYFFAPPSFGFPGKNTWLQSEDRGAVGGYVTTDFRFEECRRGITPMGKITVKAPPNQGDFSLRYRLTCEGFDSGYREFKVIVE